MRGRQTRKVLEFVHRMKFILDVKHSINIFLTHALGNTMKLTQMKNVTVTKVERMSQHANLGFVTT